MTQTDDMQLIAQLRASDPGEREAAFMQVVDRYSQRIYWTVRKIVVSHHDADDVVQNVAFTDANICGALIAYSGSGTVRNVYAQYATVTGGTDGHFAGTVFTGSAASGATVEACFIDCTGTRYSGADAKNTRIVGCGAGSAAVMNGVYCVLPALASFGETSVFVNTTGEDLCGVFSGYAALRADAAAQEAIASWDDALWELDANGCPVFR